MRYSIARTLMKVALLAGLPSKEEAKKDLLKFFDSEGKVEGLNIVNKIVKAIKGHFGKKTSSDISGLINSLKSLANTKVVMAILSLLFSGALSGFLTSCSSPTGPEKTDTVEVRDTVKVHDTVRIMDTIHDTIKILDTMGDGAAATAASALISGYLDVQFKSDSAAIKKITLGSSSGAAYTAMVNSMGAIFQASADKSLAYIKTLVAKGPIDKNAVIVLLNKQRDRLIAAGLANYYITQLSAGSPFRGQITTKGTDIFAETVLQVKAL